MEKAYVKHPVTREQKEKINRLGYIVIDDRFAPKGYKLPDEVAQILGQPETVETVETPKKVGRPKVNQ